MCPACVPGRNRAAHQGLARDSASNRRAERAPSLSAWCLPAKSSGETENTGIQGTTLIDCDHESISKAGHSHCYSCGVLNEGPSMRMVWQ